MKITINKLVDKKISNNLKKKIKKVILTVLEGKDGEVGITFVDDSVMKRLNKRFRHLDRTTDVLSFLLEKKPMLADIVISYPYAERNARKFKDRIEREIIRLVAHGCIHLTGADHILKRQRENFFKKEEKVLNSVLGSF